MVLDGKFFLHSLKTEIPIAEGKAGVYVPEYRDYLILKIVSARRSDVRDIATLIWKKGTPEKLRERMEEIIPCSSIFQRKLKEILKEIQDPRFIDSWRGTFISKEFTKESWEKVIEGTKEMID